MRSNLSALFAFMVMLLLAGACAPIPRPVETPIPTRIYGDVTKAQELFILLPGVHDTMATFEDRGFIAAANGVFTTPSGAAFIAVDAHLGYYRERSIERRLKEEVPGPAAGQRVTAVGISLGGLGVLAAARRFPDRFDRIVLIAPFLGWPESIEKLQRSADPDPEDEREAKIFALWSWLSEGAAGIPVTLLYGRDDRFREAYELLASRAPRIEFQNSEGAHDWPTWNALWAAWLAKRVEAGKAHGGAALLTSRPEPAD